MKVNQAMHSGVRSAYPNTTVHELAGLMRENDVGAIPIGENDRLIGMVTDRDIVCRCVAAGLDPMTTTAHDATTERVVFCVEEQDLHHAARIMEAKDIL